MSMLCIQRQKHRTFSNVDHTTAVDPRVYVTVELSLPV